MRNPFEVYTSYTKGPKKSQLDWEESALEGKVEGFYEEDRSNSPKIALWFLLVALFAIMGMRVFYLQIVQGGNFRNMSENNRIRRQTLLAPRGIIKDRNGQIIARNTASFALVSVPFDFPKEGLDEELAKLSGIFGLEEEEVVKIKKLPRTSFQQFVIKQNITQQQSILFETRAAEFIGFSIQKVPIREYPEAEIFSHLLGYTGLVSDADLEKIDKTKYDTTDYIGKSGIEIQYEQFLHGSNGENLVEVDASGKLLRVLGENPPLPGNVLVMNIDKELQSFLYQAIKANGPNVKAAAIAMNPKTGEVLALVSVPGFDNNLFARGITQAEYGQLLNDKNLPLFNRAVAGTYPPGSTIKPVAAAAALLEGVVNESTVIVDRGVLVIPNQFNPQIAYNFYGWKRDGLGPMTVRSAIAQSSDIYFYTVAGGHPNSTIEGLGAEKLTQYYRAFNMGKLTGIDIPGEKPGVVADPDWKAAYYKNDAIMSKWYLGDTYHIGIGQGDMLATPLQVAMWTSIIANNGIGMRPQLVKKVETDSGELLKEFKPEVTVDHAAWATTLKIVQEGMRETVLSGSGRQLSALPITAAGKTGTSQFDGADPSRTHAWFTAYAPFENPEIVITVLVEAGGEGHAVAVPVAKQTLQWWVEHRYRK